MCVASIVCVCVCVPSEADGNSVFGIVITLSQWGHSSITFFKRAENWIDAGTLSLICVVLYSCIVINIKTYTHHAITCVKVAVNDIRCGYTYLYIRYSSKNWSRAVNALWILCAQFTLIAYRCQSGILFDNLIWIMLHLFNIQNCNGNGDLNLYFFFFL